MRTTVHRGSFVTPHEPMTTSRDNLSFWDAMLAMAAIGPGQRVFAHRPAVEVRVCQPIFRGGRSSLLGWSR